MDESDLGGRVADTFKRYFGHDPEVWAIAPGRVNLLGEHTDYNGGFVLPMPLALAVGVAIGRGPEAGMVEIYSETLGKVCSVPRSGNRQGDWTDFILGCLTISEHAPEADQGLRVLVVSTLPMGAGISSSAALEVATLRALAALAGQETDPVALALNAQKVERDFVGMPCGIMDQFASSVGHYGKALFLDTRSLEYALAPLLKGFKFVTLHSGISHQLTDGSYEQRVEECGRACDMLGVEQLRDLDLHDLDRIEAIGGVEARRARHVVTENQRVLDGLAALKHPNAARFGRLMVDSHLSQRDDYAITIEQTDHLVEAALEAGALGARQTGGGFGGSIVALVADGSVDIWCDRMTGAFPATRVLAIS